MSPARDNGATRRTAEAASCTLNVSFRRPSRTLWPPPNISSPRRHDAAGPPPPGLGCQLEAAVRCKPPSVLSRPWRRGRAAAEPWLAGTARRPEGGVQEEEAKDTVAHDRRGSVCGSAGSTAAPSEPRWLASTGTHSSRGATCIRLGLTHARALPSSIISGHQT